ncbi:Conserved_hypothetical protein [Hexamita inflata]|uniref:Uncharacterized protein n=1 Tax=Hexamita inflata TaxID=28002 RepID=A0AA86UNS8_9EUKA|nr:Conserved hypothetical protein [Hexamita inflata]
MQTQELLPNIRQYLTSPTIIIFALMPIAVALLSILLCCPTSLIVTRCNSYTRYHLKHKKIQKAAQIILEQESVSKHGIPVEILINSSKVAKSDRRTMFKLSKDIYKNKQKAFKRAKCAKLCWYSWFFTIIVYFVSLILLCVGINHITHLPQDAVNKISEQIGNVKQVIDSGTVSIDKVISQFTTSDHNISQKILSDKFEHEFQSFKADILELSPLQSLLGKAKQTVEQLGSFVSKSIMFETNSDQNVRMNEVAGYLQHGFSQMINSAQGLTNIFTTIVETSDLPSSLRDSIQSQQIPNFDLVSMLGPLGSIIQLLASNDTSKWQFANQIESLINNIVPGMNQLFDVIVSKDSNSVEKNITILQFINSLGIEPDSYLQLISTTIEPYIHIAHEYIAKIINSGYLSSLIDLQDITVNELIQQLQSPKSIYCSNIWCGLLPENTLGNVSNTLKTYLPDFMQSLVAFDSYDTFTQKLNPILYAMVLIVPLSILIISAVCILSKKPFCACCSITCCSFCAVFTVLFCVLSFFISVVPQFNYSLSKYQQDVTPLIDIGLQQLQQRNVIKKTFNIQMPQSTYIQIEPQTMIINFTNVQSLFNSLNFNIEISPVNLQLPDMQIVQLLLGQSVQSITQSINSFINSFIPSNISISLNQSNISNLMNINNNDTVLSMIKINNQTPNSFVMGHLQNISGLIDDSISILYHALNITKAIQTISQLDLESLLIDMAGINISSILEGMVQQPVVQGISSAFCAIKQQVDQITPEANLIQLFADVTLAFATFDPQNPPQINSPSFSSSDGLQTLQSLVFNIFLEVAADNGFLDTVLQNPANSPADVQHEAIDTIISFIYTDQALNRAVADSLQLTVAGTYTGVDTDFDQFASFYASNCPTQQQYDDMMNAVNSGYPQVSDIIDVPPRFFQNMISRKLLDQAIPRPSQNTDPQFQDYVQAAVMHFFHCQYVSSVLPYVNVLENEAVSGKTAIYRLGQMSNVYFQMEDSLQVFQTLNDEVFGSYQLTCDAQQTPVSSFFTNLVPNVQKAVKSLVTNVLQQLQPGKLFQSAFTDSAIISSAKYFVLNLTDSVLNVLFGSHSLLNSKLLGIVPNLAFNTIHVLFEWSGYISVSLYLQMLFYVLGPFVLAFGYQFMKLDHEEKKWKKKFGAEYNGIIIGEQIVPGKVKCKHNLEESDELEGADVTGYVTQLGVSDSMFTRVK